MDDILLLPVSITFDQLHEIAEYADYARGGAKKPEGFGWLYGFIKAQGARHYGKVYVRFGEPVLLSSFLGPVAGVAASGDAASGRLVRLRAARGCADPAARRLALQKTAFEVAWRINQGMPVTATAIVSHGAAGDAGSRADVRPDPAGAGRRDGLPGEPFGAADGQRGRAVGGRAVRATLDALVSGGVVTAVRDGPRASVADRARAPAGRDVLPELADPLPARHVAVRAGRAPGGDASAGGGRGFGRRGGFGRGDSARTWGRCGPIRWRRSGRRSCGFATC